MFQAETHVTIIMQCSASLRVSRAMRLGLENTLAIANRSASAAHTICREHLRDLEI